MAFRDSWHRALVYFGLAEERDPYEEDDTGPEPEAELEDRYRERPSVRRLPSSRRRRDEIDDIFADDDPPARTTRCARSARRPRPRRRPRAPRHPEVVQRRPAGGGPVQGHVPVIINLQGVETDLSKRLIDFASGLTYALDGGMQRIADKVFMLTPRNVEISRRSARG